MHLSDDISLESGLLGGLVLGFSASGFLYLSGNVTGLSGITEGVVSCSGEDWNWSYLLGLCASGTILNIVYPEAFGTLISPSIPVLIGSGLLVGFGTRLAGGCTSGHGLCGLARRSPRSLLAVITFMGTGALTAKLVRSEEFKDIFLVNTEGNDNSFSLQWYALPTSVVLGLSTLMFRQGGSKECPSQEKISDRQSSYFRLHLASFLSALTFGVGLGISGMVNRERVLRFLDFSGSAGWDPTLAGVMGGGVLLNLLTFQLFSTSNKTPVLNGKKNFSESIKMGLVPANLKIDWKLILGSAMFGIGWGCTGLCPGPAIVSFGAGIQSVGVFLPSLFSGMVLKYILLG